MPLPSTKPTWLWLPWWTTTAIAAWGWFSAASGLLSRGLWTVFLAAFGYALAALWPRGLAPFGPALIQWLAAQGLIGAGCFLVTLDSGDTDWSWFALVAMVLLGLVVVILLTGLLMLMAVLPVYLAANRFGVVEGPSWTEGTESPLPLGQRLAVAAIFPLVLAGALAVQLAVRADPALDMPTLMEVRLQLLAVLGVIRPGAEVLSVPWLWFTRLLLLAMVGCLLALAGTGSRRGGDGGEAAQWTWAIWGRALGRR